MPQKPPLPTAAPPVRAPALHVQAALARSVPVQAQLAPARPPQPRPLQAKPALPKPLPAPPPVPPGRKPLPPPAPPLRAASPAPVQAKGPAPPPPIRRPAPHVQAATAAVQRQALPVPPPARRPPAPPPARMPLHVQAAHRLVQAKPRPAARPRAVVQRMQVTYSGSDAVSNFKYLGKTEQQQFESLGQDVKQELFKNSSLALSESAKFSSQTESSLLSMLESIRPLHLGSNPALGEPWQSIVSGYSGSKTGVKLYSAVRSPKYSAVLKKLGINPDVAIKLLGISGKKAKAPEVHHLIYKAIEPKSSVKLWNLVLTTRGSSEGAVGLHEAIHGVSSPKGRPNISQSVYVNEVPAVKGVIREWAQGPPPTVTLPNVLYAPSYDIYSQLHGTSPLGLSSPTVSYTPSFTFPDPPLSFLEQDNRFFSHSSDLGSYLEWVVEDEHDHWEELDRLLELERQQELLQVHLYGSPSTFVPQSFTFTPQPFGFGFGLELDPPPPLFPELDEVMGMDTSSDF